MSSSRKRNLVNLQSVNVKDPVFMLNKVYLLPLIAILIFFSHCKELSKGSRHYETDDEKLENAQSRVQLFIDELNLQNFNSAKEVYPDFQYITRYKVPTSFEVSSKRFTNSDKNQIKVIGTYGNASNEYLQFLLERDESGDWIIQKSKGLSSYFESNLYNVLKVSGCFDDIESDVSIHRTCDEYEPYFERYVSRLKNNLEDLIVFKEDGSNLERSYGFIRGDIMLENLSNVSLPGFTYEIFIHFLDRSGNIVHTVQHEFNYEEIQANGNHQIELYSESSSSSYRQYRAEVKIIDDSFIRNSLSVSSNRISCSDLLLEF